MKMKKLIAAFAALMATTVVASAADLGGSVKDGGAVSRHETGVNWTGVYIGAGIGYGTMVHNPELSVKDFDAFVDGIGGYGVVYNGTIGADLQRGKFVFGLFADLNASQIETEAGVKFDGDTIGKATVKEGDSWDIGARIGYLLSDRVLAYASGGYGQTDVKVTFGNSSEKFTHDIYFIGGGVEYAITPTLFVGADYRHKFGSRETYLDMKFDETPFKVTNEIDSDVVMATLKFKLGGNSVKFD